MVSVIALIFMAVRSDSWDSHLQGSKVQYFVGKKLRKNIGIRLIYLGSKMVKNCRAEKISFFGGTPKNLGQDQQQHPIMNSWGVSRGRVRGCGGWRKWHVKGDRWCMTHETCWHMTPHMWHPAQDTWHVIDDTWHYYYFFFAFSAHVERFSVSRMWDFYDVFDSFLCFQSIGPLGRCFL